MQKNSAPAATNSYPGISGWGPVANGNQYASGLHSFGPIANGQQYGNMLGG